MAEMDLKTFSLQRKRACYTEHACFPDEMPREEEKKNLHAPVAAASISDAWCHCGDGFQISSSLEVNIICFHMGELDPGDKELRKLLWRLPDDS